MKMIKQKKKNNMDVILKWKTPAWSRNKILVTLLLDSHFTQPLYWLRRLNNQQIKTFHALKYKSKLNWSYVTKKT
jgi:hypothetical protein